MVVLLASEPLAAGEKVFLVSQSVSVMDSWFPLTQVRKIGHLILLGFAAQYKGRVVKYEYLKKANVVQFCPRQ